MIRKIYNAFKVLVLVLILICAAIIANYKIISLLSQDYLFTDAVKLPGYNVLLIPGSGDSINNVYFKGRMNAVAEIYKVKKISIIIVSGRNDLPGYDEPRNMEVALTERGIRPEIIFKDYDAERTLQSIERIKFRFKKDSVIIVSQKAHLERTLFIAKVEGLHAAGYIAKENYPMNYKKYRMFREVIARLRCTYDVVKMWIRKELRSN